MSVAGTHQQPSSNCSPRANGTSRTRTYESRRQEAFYQLSALEVRSADLISIQRYVKIKDARVFGRDEEGTITLKDEHGIKIYYSRRRTMPGHIPFYQITEPFVEFTNIRKRHQSLAMALLMNDDATFIESQLEQAGCGRRLKADELSKVTGSGKSSTGGKVLDLTALSKKKPALNATGSHAVKIGSSVRFGVSNSTPSPLCHSTSSTNRVEPTTVLEMNGHAPSPSPLIDFPNGIRRSRDPTRSISTRARPLASGRAGRTSDYDGAGSKIDTRKLDLSSMRSQLEEVIALENDRGMSGDPQLAHEASTTNASEVELAIGRAGEAFESQI